MSASLTTGPRAGPGMRVELEMKYSDGEVEQLSLTIVPNAAADFEHGLLGADTPLGRAIAGLRPGETVSYMAGGGPVRARVLTVAPAHPVEGSPAAERAERARKAIRDRDQMNAILFAASTDTKWGEYDPDALREDEEEP